MGCCCKKKGERLLEEQKKEFDYIKAKKLIMLCISEDYRFKKFSNQIENFDEIMFENFFKGNVDYFHYYNFKNGITIDIEFESLLYYLEDFQSILLEWYEDESKHNIIQKLWLKRYCIYKLKDKNDQELEEILNDVISDSNKIEIKQELRALIMNSYESKVSDIKNFLKYQYPEFYSLIETTLEYKKKLEKTNEGEDCVDPLKDILTKLKEYIKLLIKKNFGEKLGNNLKNIRLWNRITKLVTEEIKLEYNNSIVIDFMTVSGLINKFKNKEGIIKILKDIGDHYKSPFLAVTNLAISFLNLCTSVKSFYNTLIDYRQKKTKYTDRLKQIHQNFESHKKKIRNLEINKLNEVEDIKGTIESIINIGKDINKEKYDLYLLIFEIQEEIERKVSEKSKSGAKIAKGVLGFLGSVVGFVFTGGGIALLYAVAAGIHGVAIGINSVDIVKQKQAIKDYISILNKGYKLQVEMEEELGKLQKLYRNLNLDIYIPININN